MKQCIRRTGSAQGLFPSKPEALLLHAVNLPSMAQPMMEPHSLPSWEAESEFGKVTGKTVDDVNEFILILRK